MLDNGITIRLPIQIYKDLGRINAIAINDQEFKITPTFNGQPFVTAVCQALYQACGSEKLFNKLILLCTQSTGSQVDNHNRLYFSNLTLDRDVTTCHIRLELQIPIERVLSKLTISQSPVLATHLTKRKSFISNQNLA